ncbi:bifunctional protein-serine/threonine kinase/phosphatase [Teredinibacter purpureus]|uniref:bifunctional protein-serine/threonine kinase/phosphatase n=1 Tax=Teredinibacter purpureus TaxID=2731756 RepID=UPI0005F823FA|nr:bifunctional protein-serine/threonine kinase/phosphatase [Teredinibacter purpureus]
MDHLKSSLKIALSQYSDKGPNKPENQDTVGARIPSNDQQTTLATKGIAIAVADGVSSSSAARQASQSAITGFLTDYYATPDTWRTQQSAMQVIRSLNQYLWGQSQNSVRGEGYLTTFSALILKGDKSFTFHIGDTRIYRVRENQLEQLTRDHTQRIDKDTTYLSRALGADITLEVDMQMEEIEPGDLFVLTSDGIHDAIPSREFKKLVLEHQDFPETITETLSALAVKYETKDNISVQAVKIVSIGTPSQADAVNVLSKLPFPPLLEAGNKIDGMTVEKILHESERSQVYLVKNSDGKPLVMKTPSVNYDDDPAYIERFVMESWIGARIQNPQVARVVTPPHVRKTLYYLTEHVAGPTLEQLIKERAPFAITDAIELLEQMVKGIRAFHRKDTLHQDIKPGNIVVGIQGATIIDFGSCWVAGIHEIGSPFQRDTILGTLDYSAPEYRYGGTVGQKSDQFSLAVLLYEMLTQKQPYGEAYSNAKDLKSFQKLNYIPARQHNPLVPFWLDKALEKALSIQPNARYSALSEWVKDLRSPNTKWTTPEEVPLLERDPVLTWKLVAAAGWLTALYLFTKL